MSKKLIAVIGVLFVAGCTSRPVKSDLPANNGEIIEVDKPKSDGEPKGEDKLYLTYGVISEIKFNEPVQFEDGLSILLKYFGHKRPYIGGPTKATAYLLVSKGGVTDEIGLSVHGVEGKTRAEDGISQSDRYDTRRWNEYDFQLKQFNYNSSIEVIIKKALK